MYLLPIATTTKQLTFSHSYVIVLHKYGLCAVVCNTTTGGAMVNVTSIPNLSSLFQKQSCWMIDPLAAELEYSVRSVQRLLAEVGYHRSFTHNGKWYTLRSIPRFDSDGLCFLSDIGFSRVGSLTNSLIELVSKSPKGMTAEQLGEKLHCRCHSVLIGLVRNGKLERWKIERSHIYIATDPNVAAIQRKATALSDVRLPAEIAVLVLVEFIKKPGSSFNQLAKAISQSKKVTVSSAQIETLFAQYGLKKTLLT